MGDAAPHGCRLANVGHIPEQHRHVAACRDDGSTQVVDRLRATERTHGPLDGALLDDPARRIQVRFFDRMHHVVEADDPGGHPLRIELHLELPEISAETLDRRHAGHGQETVVHLELGDVPQRHQIGGAGIGFQRELEDLVQPAGEAGDERRIRPLGKLTRDLRDAFRHELTRAVVVGVRLEFDGDLRDAELRVRPHAPHVGQTCERDLESEWRWPSRALQRPSRRSG